MNNYPKLRNAVSQDVDGTSDEFTDPFESKKLYRITGDVDFWYTWGETGATLAAADDDAIFVPAGAVAYDSPPDDTNVYLHIIRAAVDGTVNVAHVMGGI